MDNIVQTQDKTKKSVEQKLKESIKKYFLQLKNGCNRTLCYNEYCKKSQSNITFII